MIDLDLSINSNPIMMGELLDNRIIKNCNLMKIGFFSKILFRKLRRGIKYWAKNCEISCFHGEFEIRPHLEKEEGFPYVYGTSAYFYPLTEQIDGITFQCIGDRIIPSITYGEFIEICGKYHGAPSIEEPFHKWQDEDSIVIAELSADRRKAYFHWLNLELYSRMK